MFYLPQNFQNTTELLVFHVVDDNGALITPTSIGFKILDSAGTQVFPAAGFEDVLSAGKVSTGRYYAYDSSVSDAAWTVPAAATEGVWSIVWQYRRSGDSEDRTFSEKFEVVSSADYNGLGWRTYISPSQIRDEGVDVATLSATRLEMLLEQAQSLVEERTMQAFRPIHRTLRLDGEHIDKFFLGMPIVGIEAVQQRDAGAVSLSSLAIAFERVDGSSRFRPFPDHRRNPVIGLRANRSVFSGGILRGSRGVFGAGKANWQLTGVFGFLEADGTVPLLIQDAMKRIVIASAALYAEDYEDGGAIGAAARGPIKSARAGEYQVEWDINSASSAAFAPRSALAPSRYVEEVLKQFRTPIFLASTTPHTSFASITI